MQLALKVIVQEVRSAINNMILIQCWELYIQCEIT